MVGQESRLANAQVGQGSNILQCFRYNYTHTEFRLGLPLGIFLVLNLQPNTKSQYMQQILQNLTQLSHTVFQKTSVPSKKLQINLSQFCLFSYAITSKIDP